MSDKDQKGLPLWGLPALSWIVSFYFLLSFVSNVGFPPDRSLLLGDALHVFLWLFFLFLPFFSKVKISYFIELERELTKTKQDLQDFKTDIRNSVSMLSTNINTIGNMNNQITLNLPGLSDLKSAIQKVDSQVTSQTKKEAEEVQRNLLSEDEDITMTLAKTRIEIERLLKNILTKRSVNELRNQNIKSSGARKLFDIFIRENDNYAYLGDSFFYVIEICNAAIHSQKVSYHQAKEALALGSRIIAVLSDIAGESRQVNAQQCAAPAAAEPRR